MLSFFSRSNAAQYKDEKPGIAGLLRMDSLLVRILIFLSMSAVFFFFLRITEQKVPRGLMPDSTEDTVHVVPGK